MPSPHCKRTQPNQTFVVLGGKMYGMVKMVRPIAVQCIAWPRPAHARRIGPHAGMHANTINCD